VKSYDGNYYRVNSVYENKQEASNILALLNIRITGIIQSLVHEYYYDYSNPKLQMITKNILKRYNSKKLVENSPFNTNNDTSFVVNKGSKFAICLREKNETYNFHDIDILMFVVLHELSHLAIQGLGHDYEYWSTFKFILQFCEDKKLYYSINYNKYPQMYCGILVNHNPII
jgi:predicted metal-dependent hydrolase